MPIFFIKWNLSFFLCTKCGTKSIFRTKKKTPQTITFECKTTRISNPVKQYAIPYMINILKDNVMCMMKPSIVAQLHLEATIILVVLHSYYCSVILDLRLPYRKIRRWKRRKVNNPSYGRYLSNNLESNFHTNKMLTLQLTHRTSIFFFTVIN